MFRPIFSLSAAALFLCMFSAQGALASPRQYGDVVFDMPDGWYFHRDSQGFRRLARSFADTCETCQMFVTASQPAGADLARMARDSVSLFVGPEDPAPQESTAPESGSFGGMELAIGSWTIGTDTLFVVPVRKAGKASIIAFRGPAATPEDVTESGQTFQNDLMTLIGSLKFVSPGQGVMPPPQPGPLDGVYWGSVTNSTLGMDGMLQMDIQSRAVVFWKEGWFYEGAPPNGFAQPTPADLIPTENGDEGWGTYRIEDGMLEVTHTGGQTESFRMASSGTSFYDGDRQMFQAQKVPDGTRFSGSQTSSFYSSFDPTIMSGGAASRSYVSYFSDGTYSGGGWSSVAGTVKGAGFGADQVTTGGISNSQSEESDGGRYEVKDGVLLLTPNDGSPPRRQLIYRIGDGLMVGTSPIED